MSSITLHKSDVGMYDVFLEDEIIGYIEGSSGYLLMIDIEETYQGKGYGTAALQQFITLEIAAGAETIETSTITSPAMEHICSKLGFNPCEDDPSHRIYVPERLE